MRIARVALLLLASWPATAVAQDAPPPPPDDWGAPPPPPDAAPAPPEATPAFETPPAPPADAAPPAAAPDDPEPAPFDPAAPPPEDAAGGASPAATGGGVTAPLPRDPYRHSPQTRDFDFDDSRNMRLASGVSGPVGLAHMSVAEPGHRDTLRLSITGEFFDAHGFPVKEAQDQRTAGTLTLAYTPLPYLDVYGAYSLTSNRNSLSAPPLIQAQGDSWLGAKAGTKVADSIWVGGDVRLVIFPGIGNQTPNAVGFQPQALLTWDVRELDPQVPLRVHVSTGARIDGTGNLSDEELSAAETYALGVNEYSRFTIGTAVEAPLPWITPFLEYGVELPVGAPALLPQPDRTEVSPIEASPMRLTIGGRLTALEDVSLLLATDIGLQRHVVEGIAATPPYNLLFGLAYTMDPAGKKEQVVVERLVDRAVAAAMPPTGKVVGTVLDASTRLPVPGVVLALNTPARAGLPPVATDAAGGRFLSYDLPPGMVEIVASKDGYKPVSVPFTVEAGRETPAEILIEREARPAVLKVSVAGPGGPIDGATVALDGPQPGALPLTNGAGEAQLLPGSYRVRVTAEGFLTREATAEVAENAVANLAFQLSPKPKNTTLVITRSKITTRRTIQFRTGSAEILPESFPILDEVGAALLDNNYKRVRVDGHTDNVGDKDRNQTLSEDRAASVRQYMIKAGVDANRIESAGFGDTKPLAPNLTSRGRARNRRVEFTILEQ